MGDAGTESTKNPGSIKSGHAVDRSPGFPSARETSSGVKPGVSVRALEQALSVSTASPGGEICSDAAAKPKVNILLVDDDPRKRLALGAILAGMGHNLSMAASGEEAFRLLMERDYAVVLLDMKMPDMDGYETAKLIRSHKLSAQTPIIFVTAYDQAEIEMLRGYSAGAADYIFAPVIPEILRAKINTFVELALMRYELSALNADLKQRAAQLETANKDLESFACSISHDLRAPLRAISGFSRILQEDHGSKLDDEGRRVLGVILDSSQSMTKLIDALLVFSRYNDTPVSRTEIDMTGLAQTVFAELMAAGSVRTAEFRLSALPGAWGDPALIRQVWTNLLSNSIKYSGKRSVPVIEITGRTSGAEQIYCIKDNGAGFDMRHYEKLFGVFQRIHDAAQYSGTGVGLAIVQRVITRHGGRVWARGKVDGGAAFYFSLPVRVPARPAEFASGQS
jgi:two-component system, sensor histidine kinase and response regulator